MGDNDYTVELDVEEILLDDPDRPSIKVVIEGQTVNLPRSNSEVYEERGQITAVVPLWLAQNEGLHE